MRKGFFNTLIAVVSVVLMVAVSFNAEAQRREVFVGDRVIAVVGDRMILQSDLQMAEAYLKEQNKIPFSENFSDEERAQILNQMMTQKLLSAQAKLDSLELPEANVVKEVQTRIDGWIEEYGSVQKLEEARRKPVYMLRMELTDQIREQLLADMMKQSVGSKIKVTPEEVKNIIKGISKDSLPIIPAQYEYSQVVLKAPSNEKTRSEIKERLLELRNRVMKGDNFAALATLYSDDAETAKRGGEMVATPQMFVPSFADAMVSLTEGQVSNIVETEYGFHIIQLISKENGKYNIRHILLKTKFSLEDIAKAKEKLDSIKTEIENKKITFEQAAIKFSEDEESKDAGGVAVNSLQADMSGVVKMKSNKFFVDDLRGDYNALADLKEGEISEPFETYDNSENVVCKIVRLNKRTEEHLADVKEDYSYLVDLALSIKQSKIFNEWIKEQKAKMYVRVEEPFNKFPIIVQEWGK